MLQRANCFCVCELELPNVVYALTYCGVAAVYITYADICSFINFCRAGLRRYFGTGQFSAGHTWLHL